MTLTYFLSITQCSANKYALLHTKRLTKLQAGIVQSDCMFKPCRLGTASQAMTEHYSSYFPPNTKLFIVCGDGAGHYSALPLTKKKASEKKFMRSFYKLFEELCWNLCSFGQRP